MKELRLGRLSGLALTARPSVLVASAALWAALTALAVLLLGATAGTAIAVGLAATLLHWLSELTHQLGHAVAARQTGYPMTGIRFWGLLGTALYPAAEPALPAALHIRRALGGPIASLIVTALAGLLFLATWGRGGPMAWLAAFFFGENLLVFTLQAFIPLGFNDGATLWRWLPRR